MIKEGKREQWKRRCRAEELQDKAREKDFFSVLLGSIYPTINQYQDALDKYILKRTTETKKNLPVYCGTGTLLFQQH